MPTRRHLLVTAGIAATGAGCMGVLGEESEDSTEADPETEAQSAFLRELSVENKDDDPHEIQLAVEADGEVLHLGNYELEADGDSTTVDGEWTDEADTYRIHARIDGGEIRTTTVSKSDDEADCVRVLVRVERDAELSVWSGADCGEN